LRTKILLSQGRAHDALALTETEWVTPPSQSSLAERVVVHAFSLACLGRSSEAIAQAEQASSLTREGEIQALAVMTRLIAHLRKRSESKRTFDLVRTSGYINAFVLAYRSFPSLLFQLAQDPRNHALLSSVLTKARDGALARRAGIRMPTVGRSDAEGLLSPREREVFSLLAQGLSNYEIGKALWITEATVKAHTRHIFEKLGVRSRTEAAALVNELDPGGFL
jgi:ATP/maltotriose-dependent transcriptional regulator MalT